MKGKFITFEGSEGSGKSTQIQFIAKYLKQKKKSVLLLREPGSVKISESIRKILLDVKNQEMSDICETLLYMAARSQVVEEVIAPAIKRGDIVLCDRFLDSTLAYQGFGRRVNLKLIESIGQWVTLGIKPNLTFLFDLPIQQGLARQGQTKDRIEHRSLTYHNRVRKGYLEIAKAEPKRVKIIKANRTKEEIRKEIEIHVNQLLK